MPPLIVHVSADYPDAAQPVKTRVIAALVEGTARDFTHRVYSLNRIAAPRGWRRPGLVEPVADDGTVASWRYVAPARGLFLAAAMERVADAILADLRGRGIAPAAIHAHKLSVEGLAARRVAERLGIPFLLTLQGNSDQKIVRIRRDLHAAYRRLWHDAAAVIAFAPWIARWCARRFGARAGPVIDLPCIPASEAVIAPRATRAAIGTAFHLMHWRNKNIATLARATALSRGGALEIAGGGDAASAAAVDRALAHAGVSGIARRIGALTPADLQRWMNSCAVFALPSRRESFGLVFIEALFAGCPIVYPRGAAVDGWFDDCPFAIGVDARDPRAVARGMDMLIVENDVRKQALAEWQQSGAAARFGRDAILAGYRDALMRVVR
ncbi:glycosyltransferase [uncultured Sphingomonas sp.]|mgnify:FL=1|uniref:glycosyltransferase n=1 Tax=uncultured Sphingomonas sp. TaxID=158754 RepID=UPI00262DFA31|nr:glycosyltransferase [uncultured Sphingomonas sp.]